MEISIKWNLCRVCLLEEQKSCKTDSGIQFVPLFKENKKLALQIYELSGVSMKPDDSLPDKICGKCVSVVNNAVQLRKTCRSSDSYLQSILARTKSASVFFKPEIPAGGINDDDCEDSNGDNGEMEMHTSVLDDDESEHETEEKQNKNVDVSHEKKAIDIKSEDPLYYSELQKDETEQEANDNISDYTVELEEIIDMSEEDELYAQAVDDEGDDLGAISDNTDKNKDSREISQIQKFYMNASFGKQKTNNEETHNANTSDGESMEQDKTEEQSSDESDKEDMPENEESVSNQGLEFAAIDEEVKPEVDDSITMEFEERINKNEDQAQVSSTVETREEIECYDDDSNISNITSDMDKERSNEGNINNCNISSTNPSAELRGENLQQRKFKQKPSSIFFKSAAYEPIQLSFCEICGNRFTNQHQLKLHMKIHLQHRSHQCELCPKSFITACNLQAHMRIHTGEKPFECKYCGRRFNDRSSHIRHERTHTNEKPFECESCGKSFALATTLQNHMKVHSDERSYRCEPCGKSFKLPHHLKKHVTTSLHLSIVQIAEDS